MPISDWNLEILTSGVDYNERAEIAVKLTNKADHSIVIVREAVRRMNNPSIELPQWFADLVYAYDHAHVIPAVGPYTLPKEFVDEREWQAARNAHAEADRKLIQLKESSAKIDPTLVASLEAEVEKKLVQRDDLAKIVADNIIEKAGK